LTPTHAKIEFSTKLHLNLKISTCYSSPMTCTNVSLHITCFDLWSFPIGNMALTTRILGWKHIKVEYINMSQLVGLSIVGHGTKYKWIICEKDSKK
jgi:hypothetical protein